MVELLRIRLLLAEHVVHVRKFEKENHEKSAYDLGVIRELETAWEHSEQFIRIQHKFASVFLFHPNKFTQDIAFQTKITY